MSDAGSGGEHVTVTLSDGAGVFVTNDGPCFRTSGRPIYTRASKRPPRDNFPAPAPGRLRQHVSRLQNDNQPTARGPLYVFDDGPGDQGSFAGGWILPSRRQCSRRLQMLASPLRITTLNFDSDGVAQVTVHGEFGLNYALEASAMLVSWTRVGVQPNETGTTCVQRTANHDSISVHRAVSMPHVSHSFKAR